MFDYQLGNRLPVLEHGFVALIDLMGSDEAIVDAARISYDRRGKSVDEKLIRYLMKHRHTSPFEMCELKFEIKMPIFVMRQWIRHRTASVNEVSARYTQLPNEMHVPEEEDLKPQSLTNKQGREVNSFYNDHEKQSLRRAIRHANRLAYDTYEELLDEFGLTRELARGVLPVNTYTTCVWKINLHNLFHFLKLRTDPHAQKEIRVYAEQIERLVALKFPLAYRAWVDYSKEAVTLSKQEAELVRNLLQHYMYPLDCSVENAERVKKIDQWAGEKLTEREIKEFNRRFLNHG